jgi:hypothetical protein
MEAVYCSDCPKVLLIKDQDFFEQNGVEFPRLMPGDKGRMEYNKHLLPYYERAENLFPRCPCGGHFRFMAPPRCPKCLEFILGKGYDGKPYYRRSGYAFVTEGSISLRNGGSFENT